LINIKQTYEELERRIRNIGAAETERVQLDESLRDCEERLRNLLLGKYLAVVVHDSDAKVMFSSFLAQELLGLTEEQMSGKTATDPDWHFFLEDGMVLPVEEYPVNRVLATHQSLRDMVIGVHRAGSESNVWVQVSADPIFDEQQNLSKVIVSFIDITEHKWVKHRLELSAEIQSILNEAVDLQGAIDRVLTAIKEKMDFDAVGIRLRKDNDFPYYVQHGFTEDFLITENSLAIRLPEGGICRDENGGICLEGTCGVVLSGKTDPANPYCTPWGSFWTNDTLQFLQLHADQDPRLNPRNRCIHDGYMSVALIPIRVNQEIVGILQFNDRRKGCFDLEVIRFFEGIGVSIGIALMRLRSEEVLRVSEERFRGIFESMIPVQGYNGNREVIYWNPASEKMYGYSKQEAMGCKIEELVIPGHIRDGVIRDISRWINEDIEIPPSELSLQTKDGSEVHVYSTHVMMTNIKGEKEMFCVDLDLTERKQLEKERTKADKIESVGILAGGIAHDFNNILTTILVNVSLAKMMLDDKGHREIKERLALSEQAGKRASALTQQLLTFSKGGVPVKKTALLGEMIRESTSFSLRGSNVKCRHYIDKKLLPCEVDMGQISQVINNLVINADQSMPEGGVIRIRAENVLISLKDALPLKAGKYVRISIKDMGCGIPESYIPKIFDPYFTTKPKGNGLGLATCYSIVKGHGGHIAVESEQDIGTSFHVYLPSSSGRVLEKEKLKKKTALPRGRILVMDDERSVLEVLVKVLESLGQDVEATANGANAVKLYKMAMKSGKPFDAVILDLTIPGNMGGRETLKKLRKIDPEVKAIVSSGYSNNPVMSELYVVRTCWTVDVQN
jgi:two-component system, cell cycle sensor histidine kinase and response regulator CckA